MANITIKSAIWVFAYRNMLKSFGVWWIPSAVVTTTSIVLSSLWVTVILVVHIQVTASTVKVRVDLVAPRCSLFVRIDKLKLGSNFCMFCPARFKQPILALLAIALGGMPVHQSMTYHVQALGMASAMDGHVGSCDLGDSIDALCRHLVKCDLKLVAEFMMHCLALLCTRPTMSC